MEDHSEEIAAILERNKRVEENKLWEESLTRRGFIVILTYVAAYLFMRYNGLQNPALQALIPSGAYLLSTLTLPPLKRMWMRVRSKGKWN